MEMSLSLYPVEDFNQQPAVEDQATMAAALPSIKIEEHVAPSTITPDLLSLDTPSEPTGSSSRAVKKRKSWGQVLPEPKTALPPRKRAKTADEKEQRRIERVKRNRLAAHNSRERKREEMDKLQVKNDALLAKMAEMQKQMNAMAKELKAFRSGSSASVPSFDFATAAQTAAPMISPPMTATASSVLETPELGNLDSPRSEYDDDDFTNPATPMDSAHGAEEASLEPTQQSAALLCDLQCRSPETSLSCLRSFSRPLHSHPSPSPQQQLLFLTAILTASLNIQLFLSTVSTLSSTLTASTLRSLIPALSHSPTTSTASSTTQRLSAMLCWTTALARLATSSTSSQPTKAHLQKVATGLAAQLRRELTLSSSPTQSPCETRAAADDGSRRRDGERRQQRRRTRRLNRQGRRIVVSWNVKTACSGMGTDPSTAGLGLALQKLRARGVRR